MTRFCVQHSLHPINILSTNPTSNFLLLFRSASQNWMTWQMICLSKRRLLAAFISWLMLRKAGLSFLPIDSCPKFSRHFKRMWQLSRLVLSMRNFILVIIKSGRCKPFWKHALIWKMMQSRTWLPWETIFLKLKLPIYLEINSRVLSLRRLSSGSHRARASW